MAATLRSTARYRLGVLSRTVAAIAGGYGLAALVAAALALSLSLSTSRAEAAMAGTLTALVVYPVAVMWVFACATAWRAWTGLLLAALLPGAIVVTMLATGRFAGAAA